jgi:H+/Cl- antiporter ClcA
MRDAVLVEFLQDFKFEMTHKLMETSSATAYVVESLLCCCFVGVASFLVVGIEPASAGSGIPEAKAYLNGSRVPRYLSGAALACKAIGVSFAVAGGLCIGKEGPLVHVGSAFAAQLSHGWLAVWGGFRNLRSDPIKRDFVSGGCAAGVAAAFGAPIGGVLFSLEEASSFWSVPLLWRVFFSAMVSTFTLNFWTSQLRST